ncbi:MAG: class I SAM-dependent methyltransferase [Promethearchaeota archaeon]
MYFYEPADPQPCFYCKKIKEYDEDYPVREALYTNEKVIFRCGWHAQFQCSKCGKFSHFNWLYYCPTTECLLCGDCTPPTLNPVRFWNKSYAYAFWCEDCEDTHYDLLYSEFIGMHPWQLEKAKLVSILEKPEPWKPTWRPSQSRKGEEISVEEALKVEDRTTSLKNHLWGGKLRQSKLFPIDEVKREDSQEKWELGSQQWLDQIDKYLYLGGMIREIFMTRGVDAGDINREFIIDPALWKLIGEVEGLKVLDAGCGNGYLTRGLARKGAIAVGVDISQHFIEYCTKREEKEKLGCEFTQASLDDLSGIRSKNFDLVVSNIVMTDVIDYQQAFKEINRILKTDGRFVWSNTHPIFAKHSSLELKLPSDTMRREERMYKIIDRYFESGATQVQWFGENPLWQFERTLSEYSKGLKEAGFVIREIVEPKPTIETMQTYPAIFAFDNDRYPFFIIFDCLKL